MDPYTLGSASAILASLSWSIAAVLYRRAVAELRDPMATSGLRVPLALALMVALSPPLPSSLSLEALPWIAIGSLVGIVLGDALYMVALREVGVSVGYPVGFVYPLYASILAVAFLGERPTLGLWLGLGLALAGIWLSTFRPPRGVEGRLWVGVVAAIASGLSWGVASVVFRLAVLRASPATVNLVKLLILLAATSPSMARRRRGISRGMAFYAMVGGLFGLGLGDWLFYVGLSLIGAARATTLTTASPLASLVLAHVALGEGVEARQVVGSLMIALGVALAAVL